MIKALITRFLPNLMPGLGAFANPWIWLILIAMLAGAFAAGVRVESWHRDSADKAATEAWHKAYVAQVGVYRTNATQVAADLETERTKRADADRAWKEKLRNAKQPLATCIQGSEKAGNAPSAAAVPTVLLTPEFVGLLNDAWQVGLPAAGDPGGIDGAGTGSDPATPEDILGNVEDNASVCNGLRKQVKGWQALARKNGWVK